MLMNGIRQNVFLNNLLGVKKTEKFCTAKVNSNNCNKFTKDAARHTLLLKNIKNNKNCSGIDIIHCSITHDSRGVDKV